MLRFPSSIQKCPICGRPAQIRFQYAGKVVKCRHCRGEFLATSSMCGVYSTKSGDWLLNRADQLLETLNRRSAMPRLADG